MTIKVNYDPQTTLVKGYYPNSVNYASIPEPFIEIEDSEQDNSKQMSVVNGVYKEHIPTTEEKKRKKKDELKAPRLAYLHSTDWQAAAFVKYGRPLNSGLAEKCQLANDEINAIEACTTLTQLNTFSTTFE